MVYYQQTTRLMPPTPKLIKFLVLFSLIFGCLSGFFHSLLGLKLSLSFVHLFALSAAGLLKGFIWQPLSFLFIPQVEESLSFYFLFSLSFDLYLLWYIGCKVHQLLGEKTTFKLFFIPPILAGLAATFLGALFHFGLPLYGLTFAMIPLITAYCFSNPDGHFHFMPIQALQTRWMGLGLIVLYLFQDIAALNFTALLAHILVCVITYFYLVFFHQLKSPFPFTQKMDHYILSKKKSPSSKVIYLYDEDVQKESRLGKAFNKIKKSQKLSIWDKIKLKSYRKKDSN